MDGRYTSIELSKNEAMRGKMWGDADMKDQTICQKQGEED